MEASQEEINSKVLRAGRRTYFFDVRETKASDYYLTITESKKFTNEDGSYYYKKHKIYLYKEDFAKFVDALNEAVSHVKEELLPDVDFTQFEKEEYSMDGDSEHDSELSWD